MAKTYTYIDVLGERIDVTPRDPEELIHLLQNLEAIPEEKWRGFSGRIMAEHFEAIKTLRYALKLGGPGSKQPEVKKWTPK